MFIVISFYSKLYCTTNSIRLSERAACSPSRLFLCGFGDTRNCVKIRDPVCVAMCNLNMRLHGIGRVVTLASDLTEATGATMEQASDRPLLRVFQPARIVCGNAFDPSQDRMLAQENPWIPFVVCATPASEEASSHRTVAPAVMEKRVSSGTEEEREERLQEIALDTEVELVISPVPKETQPSASSGQAERAMSGKSRTSSAQKKTHRRRRSVPPEVVQQHLFSPSE